MTLIELLIVMGIMLVLVTLGAVNMQPEVERRRMREAARQVGVYIGSARSRAMETGRPCGVMIERVAADPRMGMVLHQVEVPPPYAGDTVNAQCIVKITANPKNLKTKYAELDVQFSTPGLSPNIVKKGDLIQFNGQGPMYQITTDGNTTTAKVEIDLSTGMSLPWPWPDPPSPPTWSLPLSFKILRQPQKSGAAPLQLPATVVMDLEWSGTDAVPQAFKDLGSGNDHTVKIMFSGSGAMEGYYLGADAYSGILPVYLLVGKRQRVLPGGLMPEDNLYNYQDFDNYWIAITPQGLVATDQVGVNAANATNIPADPYESRQFVRGGRSKGGG